MCKTAALAWHVTLFHWLYPVNLQDSTSDAAIAIIQLTDTVPTNQRFSDIPFAAANIHCISTVSRLV